MHGPDNRESTLGMSRKQEYGVGQASARGEQSIELAALLELIESTQGGDDPLPGMTVLPAVLDDLEVRAWAGLLGAEKHGVLPRDTMNIAEITLYSRSK
jgi:hypothetical protein